MRKMTLFGLIGLAVGALALFGLKWAQRLKSTSGDQYEPGFPFRGGRY
ncbi:MAG: hypothetical protein JW843_04930 [Candidatus Aminicenantes bacterium]|nr:hypothetical protein [Candidatus Aminicenantes bacterium]